MAAQSSLGSLIGTLTLANPSTNTTFFAKPFQLGLHSSSNLHFVSPAGTLTNGWPYVDLTAALLPQLGANGELQAGQSAVVDGIEVYTRDRSAPSATNFEFWCNQNR